MHVSAKLRKIPFKSTQRTNNLEVLRSLKANGPAAFNYSQCKSVKERRWPNFASELGLVLERSKFRKRIRIDFFRIEIKKC